MLLPASDAAAKSDLPALAHAVLKHLTLEQLEKLAEAVESGTGAHSDCLHTEERFATLGRHGEVDLVQLLCRLFRWPKAPLDAPLVNFCDEEEAEKEPAACLNPYHWSLALDSPIQTSSISFPSSWKEPLRWPLDCPKDRQCLTSTEDSAIASSLSSEPFSSELCSSAPCPALPASWCSLSYWELLTHVGARWFPVRHARLHLGAAAGPWPPPATCIDVSALQQRQPALRQPMAPLEADLLRCVSRARRRIGAGVVLVRRGSQVWLHNRSSSPVFVSPQCGAAEHGTSARRLPPDHALALFDLELWRRRLQQRAPHPPTAPPGPIDPRVVHVSFGKGWGANYKRQDVTLCPCRLEILFHLPKA